MTLKHVLFAVLAAMTITAYADPKTIYIGDGRFACQGNSTQCAQVDANNRQRESQRANDYQRDQDRAQAIVDRERRKEDDRRYQNKIREGDY